MNNIPTAIFIITIILSITSCKLTKNREVEPNNTFSDATLAGLNNEYYGTLHSENDIDNYRLNIMENLVLQVELSGIKGVNHAITLYRISGTTGEILKVIDDNRKSSPESFSNLAVSAGQYIISVHHGEMDVRKGNSESEYMLRITAGSLSDEELEPDDEIKKATYITGDTVYKGFFSPARNKRNENPANPFREEDWYAFDISTPENIPVILNINLTGVSGVDSVIELYDSSANRLEQADAAGAGDGESLNGFGIRNPGRYYVVIAAKNYQYNGNQPYNISLSVRPYEQGNELEPNNSTDDSNEISGNGASGRFNNTGDIDYYLFTAPVKGVYRIELEHDEGIVSRLEVIPELNVKLFDVSTRPGEGSIIIPDIFVKEKVYICVSAQSISGVEGNYRLIINEVNPILPYEIEPNDKKDESTLLTGKTQGYTTTANDTDYYLIKNDIRTNYKISLKTPENGSLRISTTDQQGYIIKTKEGKNGETVIINEIYDRKGYIIIESIDPDFDNAYELITEAIQ